MAELRKKKSEEKDNVRRNTRLWSAQVKIDLIENILKKIDKRNENSPEKEKNVKSIRDKVIYRDKQGTVNIYNWRSQNKKKVTQKDKIKISE